MSYPRSVVDEVRSAASIVTVVSAYLPLKKAGRSHKGLCPFHSEKTPSFNVDEERGLFHCFGCGAGGDVFRFVMEHDRVGFMESVRTVASLMGMTLPAEGSSAADDRRERLYQVNEAALSVYREWLGKPSGDGARSYLRGRGIGDDTVATFELGVASGGWEGISRRLLGSGYRAEELVAAGLAKSRSSGGGIYDRFHDRLMFPIRNGSGRLVGFGGRSLTGQEPKYLNSPETELYRKGEILYGLYLGRDALRRAGHAVLVEGYMDLIALHQVGVREVVASLGTSLTAEQARLVGRFARKVYISYDGDSAGRSAAKRALKGLLGEGMEVAIVEVGDGLDPDDLVRSRGAEAFRDCMSRARGLVAFLLDGLPGDGPGGSGEERARAAGEVLPFLALVQDPLVRATHVARLAERVNLDEAVIEKALRRSGTVAGDRVAVQMVPVRRGWSEAEGTLVMALAADPGGLVDAVPWLEPEDWVGLTVAPVLDAAWMLWQGGAELSLGSLSAGLEDEGRELLAAIAVRLPEVSTGQGAEAARTLRAARLKVERERIQRLIGQTGDGPELDELLRRKQELSRTLDELG